jgi:hypothetical protein
MQAFRLDVENALLAIGRGAAACSTRNAIGFASYIRRSLPGLSGVRLSAGYMKMPPRFRIRCTSATIDAIQRMLKSL